MATKDRQKDAKPSGGRGKITVVMFQLEGDDSTLQDAIKVLGQGMDKLASPTPVYKVISAPPGSRASLSDATEDTPPTLEGDAYEADATEDAAEPTDSEKAIPRKRRPQKALTPLKGVDWETGTPFRDYCQQKKPSSNYDKFVVIAGWFKNIRDENTVTPPHIAAGFDVMDWTKPEDIGGVFRQIKHDKAWFDKGAKNSEWVLAQRGINHLDRMGKADASGDA